MSEVLNLRIGDIALPQKTLRIEFGKGGKHREVPLSAEVAPMLANQIEYAKSVFQKDKDVNNLPFHILEKKPGFTFHKPANLFLQPLFVRNYLKVKHKESAIIRPLYTRQSVDKALKTAQRKAGIPEKGFHSLRHGYATYCNQNGMSLREIQLYLGHASIETTQIYTHTLDFSENPIISPIDELILD